MLEIEKANVRSMTLRKMPINNIFIGGDYQYLKIILEDSAHLEPGVPPIARCD